MSKHKGKIDFEIVPSVLGVDLVEDGDSRLSDSRVPTGPAGGDLDGTYPDPSVDDGADATAIHDNIASEISVITEKASPINADIVIIEDSAAGNAKKRVQLGNIPSAAGLKTKAGKVLAAAFSGNPKTAGVTFAAAFADSDYSISLSCETTGGTTYTPCEQSVIAASFTINLASNQTTNLIAIHWIAIEHGES